MSNRQPPSPWKLTIFDMGTFSRDPEKRFRGEVTYNSEEVWQLYGRDEADLRKQAYSRQLVMQSMVAIPERYEAEFVEREDLQFDGYAEQD